MKDITPKSLFFILISFIFIQNIITLDNGLGRTPQMGWNTWNKFGCNISERLIRETIDFFNKSGFIEAGYKYINLDDCWQIDRNNITNKIIADPDAFPSGIKSLADYAHEKGLLLGLYSDAGDKTCAGRPGSLGYEKEDAETYAEWGIDYLKYDNCYNNGIPSIDRYPKMRDALKNQTHSIFYSICQWGEEVSSSLLNRNLYYLYFIMKNYLLFNYIFNEHFSIFYFKSLLK